jgi:hypothetical protein
MGLCHGMSGNAYALLSLYHVTKDDLYKCRAQHFGQFMADHWKELKDIPDAPLSLYEVRLCKLNSGARGVPICRWQESPTQSCTLLLYVFRHFSWLISSLCLNLLSGFASMPSVLSIWMQC